jgi:hypothetical protein
MFRGSSERELANADWKGESNGDQTPTPWEGIDLFKPKKNQLLCAIGCSEEASSFSCGQAF